MTAKFARAALVASLALSLASACPAAPLPVVVIDIENSGESPERLEKSLTTPIEKRLIGIARIKEINSQTDDSKVRVEIHFESGATRQDLAAVTEQIEALKTDGKIRIDQYKAHLDTAHIN